MKRVVITGIGILTSIGTGKEEFWANLLKGHSGISEVTAFDTSEHFTHLGGQVKSFKPEKFGLSRYVNSLSRASLFGLAAAELALGDAKLNLKETDRNVAVCIGTTMGSVQSSEYINEQMTLNRVYNFERQTLCKVPTNSTSSAISTMRGLHGPSFMFSTACAAGNYAIGYGFDLIRLERAEIAIVGGAEPFSKVAFTGFNQFKAVAPEKCQPFDKNRKGMMVAEGAGVLILESLEHALSRGAEIYAEVMGYGLSCDAKHMTTPSIEGIVWCMKKALNEAGIGPEDVDYISAHGTGTVANDRAEVAAIKEVFGSRYRDIPVSSIKSMLGHTMGAASAIEAAACALAIKTGNIPPTINFETPDPECDIDCVPNVARRHDVNIAMNNSYAFGGNNASLILKKYTD
ncbi:MAG: beta-ketoacyl-[acyl-carrier-protein] synthase family protein [Nitrospirae bacterium]|nr:MAG: beta-ketoacyl-[acyl-carrier-protein] synthase family protein [Nitrospirota bacterium]